MTEIILYRGSIEMSRGKIICMALFASLLFLLTACSNNKLVGKWYNSDYDLMYEFKANGEGIITSGDEMFTFEYEISDGLIAVVGIDDEGITVSETYGFEIINDDSLVLNDNGSEAVFERQ